MYRFFTVSYDNFISLGGGGEDVRSRIAAPFKLFRYPELYRTEQRADSQLYREASNLVYHMRNYLDQYPSLAIFADDLTYKGFAGVDCDEIPVNLVEEQMKLLDLLLSFAYV